jgi:hypothetical protein
MRKARNRCVQALGMIAVCAIGNLEAVLLFRFAQGTSFKERKSIADHESVRPNKHLRTSRDVTARESTFPSLGGSGSTPAHLRLPGCAADPGGAFFGCPREKVDRA